MRNKLLIFTIICFVVHLTVLSGVRADEAYNDRIVNVEAQQDETVSGKAVDDDDVGLFKTSDTNDDKHDISYDKTNSALMRWYINGYFAIGYGLSFATPMSADGIEYGSLSKKFQHGFFLSSGALLNDMYGIGISFIRMWGGYKIDKDDAIFRSIKSNYYMINIDLSLVIPIRFWKERLQLYVVGGTTGLFSTTYNDYKNSNSVKNPDIKFSIGANFGGGIELCLTRHFSIRLEGRYMILPNSAVINDFFMTHVMFVLRI